MGSGISRLISRFQAKTQAQPFAGVLSPHYPALHLHGPTGNRQAQTKTIATGSGGGESGKRQKHLLQLVGSHTAALILQSEQPVTLFTAAIQTDHAVRWGMPNGVAQAIFQRLSQGIEMPMNAAVIR